jgi:transposase InsO family protein
MSTRRSPATKRPYGVARVCRVWKVARSSVYSARALQEADRPPARRRGPTGPCSDDELVERIRGVLVASPFDGEGYRKVWARLRFVGTRTSKERVRRLMREHGLAAPHHPRRVRGSRAHDRRITTDRPDEMWGTDATGTLTREGYATIFLAVDHCTGEIVGIHAAKKGDRLEALEPIRQGVRACFGDFREGVAAGLALRHDHGIQYMRHHFQDELRFLGIRSSPAFIAEPECNGVAERYVKRLKEKVLWVRTFDTIEELRRALHDFKDLHNHHWLVRKHGHRTPAAVRASLAPQAAVAA